MRTVPLLFLASSCLWIGNAEHDERKAQMAIEFELADVNPDAWSLCEGDVPNFAVAGTVAGRHEGQTFDAWYEVEGDVRRQAGKVTADPAGGGRSTVTFQVELSEVGGPVADCTDLCVIPMKVGLTRLGLEGDADASISIVAAGEPELVSSRFTGTQGAVATGDVALQPNPADSVDTTLWTSLVLEIRDAHQQLELGGTGTVVACPVGLDPVADASSCIEAPTTTVPGTDGDIGLEASTAAFADQACDPDNVDVRWVLFGKITDHACGGPYVFPLDAPSLRLVASDCDDDNYTVAEGDCDDDDPARNPQIDEVWYDGVDSDCGGGSDYDRDGDGVDADTQGGTDCDDDDPSRYPGAPEVCDGRDNDCDSLLMFDQVTLFAGVGSLNYDNIADAVQAAGDGDEVSICPGTYREEIVIDASIDLHGNGAPGDTILEPDTPGVAAITIDGSGNDVTLSNLRVTGATGIDGGGIDGRGADTLTVTSCEIDGNRATRGGGLLVQGNVTLIDTTITGNNADEGGGIATEAATILQLEGDTALSGNQALTSGGGIHASSSVLSVDDTVSIDTNDAPIGGGVALVGAGTLSGGTLDANTASEGAGIALVEGVVAPTFTISDTTVQNHDQNTNARGSGLHAVGDGIDLTLDSVTITSGFVYGDGGGVYIEGTGAAAVVTMTDNLITSNEAANDGGGMFVLNAELDLDGDDISANVANNGGGLAAQDTLADFRGVDFGTNEANNQGGAILGVALELTTRNTDFDQNIAGRGAAMYLDASTAECTNGSWTDNAAGNFGGGVSMRNGTELTWTGTAVVSGNTAGGDSEAAYVEGGTLYGCDLVDVTDDLVPAGGGGTTFNPGGNGCFEIDDNSFSFGDCTVLPPC